MKLNIGFGFSGGSGVVNICFTTLQQSGNYIGTTVTPPDNVHPAYTADGVLIYEIRVYDDGLIELKFGDTGTDELTNTKIILIEYNNVTVGIEWDATMNSYRGSDIAMYDTMAPYVGNKVCFHLLAVPDLLIHYDFSAIKTEV